MIGGESVVGLFDETKQCFTNLTAISVLYSLPKNSPSFDKIP